MKKISQVLSPSWSPGWRSHWRNAWPGPLRLLRQVCARLPTTCLLCGGSSRQPYSLCVGCENDLPRAVGGCRRCARPLAARDGDSELCGRCLLQPPAFDLCRPALLYRPPVNQLIAAFKYRGRLDAGYALSCLLARQMQAHYGSANRPDYLLAVPLHPRRWRQRGFNQALEITRTVATECHLPVAPGWVRRRRNTSPQTEQTSVSARQRNMRGAFAAGNRRLPEMVRHVAVIDDVVTTTATVESLCGYLRTQGVRRLDVWCLARAWS